MSNATYDDTTRRFASSLQAAYTRQLRQQADELRQEIARATAAVTSGGISVTVTLAALTPGGTQGSMTFVNGILTAHVPAT
jgi:hypothetical protein